MKHIFFITLAIIITFGSCTDHKLNNTSMTIQVVPPISEDRILPTGPIENGYISNELNIVACRGEYEPASFVITAGPSPITALQVSCTNLQGESAVIPADRVDIKAVKCWYQSGSAWKDYPQDLSERHLIPELLLNDDKLIKVDYKTQENYLRHPLEKEEYVWISNPNEKYDSKKPIPSDEFPLKDSPVLLPVDIPANTNKQLWITVHVPQEIPAGIYSGQILLNTPDKNLANLDFKLRVLPFELLEPYYDTSVFFPEVHGRAQYELRFRKQLQSLVSHGVTSPIIYSLNAGNSKDHFKMKIMLKEAGISLEAWHCQASANWPQEVIKQHIKFFKANGVKDVYLYGIDEASGDRLTNQRPAWERIRAAGGKIMATGTRHGYFETMGDICDLFICHGTPTRQEADKWHSIGHKIWSYGSPFSAAENPELHRRNYGLLLWKANWDGPATYAYQIARGNPYNDFDGGERDQHFVYPTIDGVIDTIAWEGYREAIDDVRYVTTLEKAIEKAENSSDRALQQIAANAQRYLNTLDVENRNLGTIRMEMIEYLLKLERKDK